MSCKQSYRGTALDPPTVDSSAGPACLSGSAKAGAGMKNAGTKQDAFALLMSAGRKQQQNSKHQQQKQQNKKRSPQSALRASTKRHCSSLSEGNQPSQALCITQENAPDSSQQTPQPQQQQQQQQQQQHGVQPSTAVSSIQVEDCVPAPGPDVQAGPFEAGLSQSAAGSQATPVSKQAAVEAFKRAFSGKHLRPAKQKFDYFLVYDLEATTNKARTLHPVEIIELSCVVIQTATASITASYQTFVKPTEHPRLDPFCIELCGIQQQDVDAAPLLADALQQHHAWLEQQGVLAEDVSSVPVTWTEWDLMVALCTECRWRRIQRPDYLCRWVDLKRHYKAKYRKTGNLRTCVEAAGLVWQGRAHSGIDDATNTANLAIKLMGEGVQLDITQTSENPLVQSPPHQQQGRQLGSQGRLGTLPPNTTSAAAAATGKEGSPSIEQDTGLGHLAEAAVTNDAAPSQLTPGKGRPSMAQRAARNGVAGVFDASGRWLGRCFCGVKAKHRVTKRPGANHGRGFWSCGCWTITAATQGCRFFMWDDE